MSQQDKQKKFFWRIHSNFFQRYEIDLMECEPFGKDAVLIYLKLLCEACVHNGELRYSQNKPYTLAQLKHRTGGYKTFDKAWEYFIENELVIEWDNGTFYLPYADKQSGKETGQTLRTREQRVENFNQECQENQPELNDSSTITTTTFIDIDKSINNINKTTTTNKDSGGSYTSIKDSLSLDEIRRIGLSYYFVDELIDEVEDEVFRKRKIIEHPYEYVMGYAKNKNWYKREVV